MSEITVRDPATVRAVMEWRGAVPPVVDGPGPTLALRAAMARFADATEHDARRAEVEAAIATVDVEGLGEAVHALTRARFGERSLDANLLARQVPTQALAAALGLDRVDVADVDAIAAVIGRGSPATPAADAATERLLALAAAHPAGAVAAVSLLYQCLDATAALLLTTLHASVSGAPRVAAVPRTRRVAARQGVVGALAVSVGDVLVVELGQAGLEFGAGPHECPGRAIADAIVVAMCQELAAGGYDVDPATVTTDADGRPVAATLSRADSSGRQLEPGS